MRKKAGFTLVELLVVVSLVSLTGMALYAMFASGIGMMRRVSHSEASEDVSIFLEKFDREISSQALFHGLAFSGGETALSFPSRMDLDGRDPMDRGIGRISYFFDESHRAFARRQENLSQVHQKQEVKVSAALGDVRRLKFQYFVFIKDKRTYEWVDAWNALEHEGLIPSAVKLEFEYSGSGERHVFERTFAIPIADITR